jgi:copper chaperone NosL
MLPITRTLLPALLAAQLLCQPTFGADNAIPAPSAQDKCPVCGMFVGKYQGWIGAIRFKNSQTVYFDGPKDLLTYCLNIGKYNRAQNPATVVAIQVKDYYSVRPTDARKAYYVIGSDVYGPMGKELVPFEKGADANGFLKDHKGNKVLRFGEITPAVLKSLE